MSSIHRTARQAGAIYFLFMILAIVGEFVFPRFMIPGDAAATARNIAFAETTYRIGILLELATMVVFLLLIVVLYKLLGDVDQSLARFMVLLVSIGVAVSLANLSGRFAPLVLVGGADGLSGLTQPQLEALALGALRLRSNGGSIPIAFWGLWLFPFGLLVIRSGFLPRILGILLIVAGFAYLISSLTSIVLPAYRHVVSRVMMPLYFAEVPVMFGLVISGARVAARGARS